MQIKAHIRAAEARLRALGWEPTRDTLNRFYAVMSEDDGQASSVGTEARKQRKRERARALYWQRKAEVNNASGA